MSFNPPLTAAGPRDPQQRPRPIPRNVRDAIRLMIWGKPGDDDCAPLDFVEAAKHAGIRPYMLRKYFDRANVRALLRSERRAFREILCCGNEDALRRVRDKSANSMAQVAAVRALEQLSDGDDDRLRGPSQSPGITIRIVQQNAVAPPMVDVSPAAVIPVRPAIEATPTKPARPVDANGDLVFQPSKPWD
jgi:hypothetical protein